MIGVKQLENGLFEVESFSGNGKYVVDMTERTCTCPHFRFRGVQCKHIKFVEEALRLESSKRLLKSFYKSKEFPDADSWERDLHKIGLI